MEQAVAGASAIPPEASQSCSPPSLGLCRTAESELDSPPGSLVRIVVGKEQIEAVCRTQRPFRGVGGAPILNNRPRNSSAFGSSALSLADNPPRRASAVNAALDDVVYLKILLVAIFLPEGLSVFIGDARLSPARIVLIALLVPVMLRWAAAGPRSVLIPSDLTAIAAGIWIVAAAMVTGGFMDGLKGGGALALDFAGAYYAFRRLLGPVNSSVRLIRFSGKLIMVVIALALLDPLTGKLFTYEVVKRLTGYTIVGWEWAAEYHADTMFRKGFVRAMGPMEHSILFGAACAWFGTLALFTFPLRTLGKVVAVAALVGIVASQAKAPLLAYAIALGLAGLYDVTRQFAARWRVVGCLVAAYVAVVFLFSSSPIATLLRFGGLDPQAGWYREAIWETAGPLVLHSPLFGLGLTGNWDWQASSALVGGSVDAFWLASAMMFGIPGSLLVFLTIVGAFWRGSIDKSPYLSREEQRLSVALGIVAATTVFLGFTVHIWGACWILLGAFAGIRANLAEAAILRRRAPS